LPCEPLSPEERLPAGLVNYFENSYFISLLVMTR
jgi:hypothetical protein